MADPREYLASLSEHPDRAGDTAYLNPDFANRLATALQQANAQGLHLGVMSGFREPGQTGSAYDAGGNSSHSYGLASDVSGLDGPNGRITQQWAQIAEANGLHNPYTIGNAAEFNHWQLPPQPLEKTPALLAQLQTAKASGNIQNVWNAYSSSGGSVPSTLASAATGPDFYHAAMMHESGGQNIPNAAGGGAGGYYQFMPGTWAGIRAARPDLNLPETVLAANQDQQTAAYRHFVSGNVAALQAAGIPINDKNVFMASFLGSGGASKFISEMQKNPGSAAAALFPTEAASNPKVFLTGNGQSKSLAEVYGLMTGTFGSGNTTGFGPNATPAAPGGSAQVAQTAAPPSMGSMLGQALAGMSAPASGGGGGLNSAMMAQAAPPAPGPQLAFRAAADDAAQASQSTAGGPPGAGAPGQPGTGAAGMTGLLGLMSDPNTQNQLQLPTDTPMVGMSGLLYGGGAGLGVRHPAVTRLT